MWEEVDKRDYPNVEIKEQEFKAKNPSDSFRQPLQILSPPKSDIYYVGPKAAWLYQLMKEEFGVGEIVPYSKIAELGKERMGLGKVALHCDKLWKKGLLRKWVQGIWREGFLKRSNMKVGRYYGVHYEVIK